MICLTKDLLIFESFGFQRQLLRNNIERIFRLIIFVKDLI